MRHRSLETHDAVAVRMWQTVWHNPCTNWLKRTSWSAGTSPVWWHQPKQVIQQKCLVFRWLSELWHDSRPVVKLDFFWISIGIGHNETGLATRRELNESLNRDSETWWSQRAPEMKRTVTMRRSERYVIPAVSGRRRLGVSETTCENHGSPTHNQQWRIVCPAEYWNITLPVSSFGSTHSGTCLLVCFGRSFFWGYDLQANPNPWTSRLRALMDFFQLCLKMVECCVLGNFGICHPKFGTLSRSVLSSVVGSIFRECWRSDCTNLRSFALIPITSKLLLSVIPPRSYNTRNV